MCKGFNGFLVNITLYSIEFDVQHDCFGFEPSYTSQNVAILHIKLNQLKHRKSLTRSTTSFNGARIKVHLLQKEVTMFKLKG